MVLVVRNHPPNAVDIRDMGLSSGSRRSPGGGHGNPLQYSCLGNHHGQRSLAGYSPWVHKESDRTEVTQHTSYRGEFDSGLSEVCLLVFRTITQRKHG